MDPAAIDVAETTDATTLPDASAPWVRRLMHLSAEDVLKEAAATWPELKQAAWKFAFLVYRIDREGLYRPHDSLTAWARATLGKDSGTVSKYKTAAGFVLTLEDPDDQRQVMRTPPATLAEAGVPRLAKTDRAEAIRLAASGMTQRELVQAVRVREAHDQHLDVGPLKTFKLVLPEEAHLDLLGAWHLIGFASETPAPSDGERAKNLAAIVRESVQLQPETLDRIGAVAWSQGWRIITDDVRQIEQAFDGAEPSDAELQELGVRFILLGRVRCIECGAVNANGLEGHHTAPKSHAGHASPMVFLCQGNHQAVTEAWDAHWKEHNRRWMARTDLHWFKAAFEHWLGGRRLEGL